MMKIKIASAVTGLLITGLSYSANAAPAQETQTAKSFIAGKVASLDGKPSEGIEVWARRMDNAEFYRAVTSNDGRYKIEGLQPGRYYVWLFRGHLGEAAKWTKNWAAHKQEVTVPDEGRQNTNFQFVKGAVIEGRVVSKATGKPIAGQYIGLLDSQEAYRYAVTKADGTFRFRVIGGVQHLWFHQVTKSVKQDGKWSVLKVSPRAGYTMPKQKTFDVTVQDGQSHMVKIELPST